MFYKTDLELEIIGGLMLSSATGSNAWPEIADILLAEHFSSIEYREAFVAIKKLAEAGKPHDALNVAAVLGMDAQKAFLYESQANTASARSIRAYAETVRTCAQRRAIMARLTEACQEAESCEPAQLIASTCKALDEIVSIGTEATIFAEAVSQATRDFDRSVQERKLGKTPGIPFGLPELDRATGGMRQGELIGIAARTSLGKTAFANQVAVHAAMRGHRGLIVTLEENPANLAMRAIANHGAVPLARMRQGDDSVTDSMAKTTLSDGFSEIPLWIDHTTFELRAIAGRITYMVRRYGIEFAIVDHIGLVNVSAKNGQKRYELVGEVTRTLKQLAETLGIPIVPVIQVGRDSEREKRPPRLSDMRESGNIEQDLNVCIALHQAQDNVQSTDINLQIGLLKNRYGPRGWLKQQFIFRSAIQRFDEIYRGAA